MRSSTLERLRHDIMHVIGRAVETADPETAVLRSLRIQGPCLEICNDRGALSPSGVFRQRVSLSMT